MKPKLSLSYCLLVLFALAGCKKDNNLKSTPKANSVAQLDTSIDIYVLGNSATRGAILWKNGVETKLSGLPNHDFTGASGMVVNGSDIYIAGSAGVSSSDNSPTPVYWKNGVINQFANSPPFTNVVGIAISGTDVYVSATVQSPQYAGVYWKNGVLNQITDGSEASFPESITVQNNNIYILYNEFPANTVTSYVWQNGAATQLSHPSPSYIIASSMLINGNDVYVTENTASATSHEVVTLWKNNIVQNFPQNTTFGGAGAIAIWNNDTYVVGSSDVDGSIVLWKNGVVAKTLSSDLSGIKIAIVPH